jgi:hypothetical protein
MRWLVLFVGCLSLLADSGRATSAIEHHFDILYLVACATNNVAPITKTEWKAVNDARKLLPDPYMFDWDNARTNTSVNRGYFAHVLRLTEIDLQPGFRKAHKREAFAVEVYAAWAYSLPKFAKAGYDITNIRDDRVKLAVQKIDYEQRIKALLASPRPPPLPR